MSSFDNNFIKSISMERRSEIDAAVMNMESEIKRLGLDGLKKDSISLEEFKRHINEKISQLS